MERFCFTQTVIHLIKDLQLSNLQKTKDGKFLIKLLCQLANYEQSDNIKQSIKLSNDIILYYIDFIWSKCHKGIEHDGYSDECNHCNDYGCSSKKEYYIDTINLISHLDYISKKDIGKKYFFTYEEAQTKLKELQNAHLI